jgi:hypothetical protein
VEDSAPRPPSGDSPSQPEKSFGNMSERHWSRARDGANAEAIDYYRERSKAPGVAEGGGSRNMYCMRCDGVIPLGDAVESCPHCGVALEGEAKRFFNWVELDRAPKSDLRALWPFFAIGVVVLAGLVWFLLTALSTVDGPGA